MKLSSIVCASFVALVALALTTDGALARKDRKERAMTSSPNAEATAPDAAAPGLGAPDATNAGMPPGPKTCQSKGLTWDSKLPNMVNAITGTITVGCHGGVSSAGGPPNGVAVNGDCGAYHGDTRCDQKLPLLCINKNNPSSYPKPTDVVSSPYYQWTPGVVGTTKDVVPCMLPNKTLQDANAICQAEFGPGWRVAEDHDGGTGYPGWDLQAYGGVGDHNRRFWVNINDQPDATCWTQSPTVVIYNLPMQGGNEKTPCPGVGVVYSRSDASTVPYLSIMLSNLDQQCANKGPGMKLMSIKFLTCHPDPRGVGFGPEATADLTCG